MTKPAPATNALASKALITEALDSEALATQTLAAHSVDTALLDQQCQQFLTDVDLPDAAHQLDHILRVVNVADKLARQENADLIVVRAAAWLHDCVALPKDHPKRHLGSTLAADKAVAFLAGLGFSATQLDAIHHAIVAHSFSANVTPTTLEAKIVQDADRLDALGAIGIARCLQVGTALKRDLYSLVDPLCETRTPDDSHFTIDHFFTKLFKLPDTMNTLAGRKEAHQRATFMQQFLNQLGDEITFKTNNL
uniref:HD domain-containing protein n=1 Tax=Thaumasiovibrio occultus TaxID=1891184 RepID=UPI000B364106|nr:HD domain-containing protein [Thaumasiovibrio occultus]